MINSNCNFNVITLLTQLYALLCVLFDVAKLDNGVVICNKSKNVEHWAQESDKGLADVEFV